jgi:hypothetical protein
VLRLDLRFARRRNSLAVANLGIAPRPQVRATSGFQRFLGRYFYFAMALLMGVLVFLGFHRTIDVRLLHATPPRPRMLWFHAAAFSVWMVWFITQSALVRVRRVSLHRTLGWTGAALAAIMVVSGVTTSVVLLRFYIIQLGRRDVAPFLSVLWCDLIIFGACMALAIYLRRRPEYHRRLVFMAQCQLMQAAFVRFSFIGAHDLSLPALDLLIVAGMMRDLVVDGRVHRIYLYVFPSMLALQALAIYLERVNPAWWQAATGAILGV